MAEVRSKPELARALYVPGELGFKRVAKMLGVSATTVRRWVNPERAQRDRELSRAAKQRRTGICEICGGVTRYHGRGVNGPARICAACAHKPHEFCKRGHALTPENRVRAGKRSTVCRICRNAYMREWSTRRRREEGVLRRRLVSDYE